MSFFHYLALALGWFLIASIAGPAQAQTEKDSVHVTFSDGFESAESGIKPSDWFVPVPSYASTVVEDEAASGQKAVQLTPIVGAKNIPFGNLMRQFAAGPYAGKRVKLIAKIKVLDAGSAQMWLRADLKDGEIGAFDNMGDRPIAKGDWTSAVIERVLKPLAPTIQVWAGTPADQPHETILREAIVPTKVRFWRHVGAGTISTTPSGGSVYSSKVQSTIVKSPIEEKTHAANFRVKELGGGVCCKIPVRVYADGIGTLPHGETPEAWKDLKSMPELSELNRATRLAGVASAWGIFQHFYPYFDVVDTDWDAALLDGLRKAAEDSDATAYLVTLSELVAKLHDGHGNVIRKDFRTRPLLPLIVDWVGNDLVVTRALKESTQEIKIGDVVRSIDGRSASDCHAEVSKGISAATEGWRRVVSPQRFLTSLRTSETPVVVLRRSGNDGKLGEPFTVNLQRTTTITIEEPPTAKPQNGSEIAPGIVYFNLDAADSVALKEVMSNLDQAKGIVFDMRGYPGDAALRVIERLIDRPSQSAYWNVPIIQLPDREGWKWNDLGRWTITPVKPRWKMPVAFMTDARAISYAESIMGIIEHYKLGEIVGSTTAGTNGNVNSFELPGKYVVTWTGMKVLKHDGSQHHGIGIAPTVPVTPTAAGIAAGRDELLEKAIEVVQSKRAETN